MARKKSKIIPFPKMTWKTVDSNTLYEGQVIFENGNTRIVLTELELDYGGCYYEGDQPSISAKIETQVLS